MSENTSLFELAGEYKELYALLTVNRATQQMTATGSTFKPLMSLAGLGEGIITTSTVMPTCQTRFSSSTAKRWNYSACLLMTT